MTALQSVGLIGLVVLAALVVVFIAGAVMAFLSIRFPKR